MQKKRSYNASFFLWKKDGKGHARWPHYCKGGDDNDYNRINCLVNANLVINSQVNQNRVKGWIR